MKSWITAYHYLDQPITNNGNGDFINTVRESSVAIN